MANNNSRNQQLSLLQIDNKGNIFDLEKYRFTSRPILDLLTIYAKHVDRLNTSALFKTPHEVTQDIKGGKVRVSRLLRSAVDFYNLTIQFFKDLVQDTLKSLKGCLNKFAQFGDNGDAILTIKSMKVDEYLKLELETRMNQIKDLIYEAYDAFKLRK